MKKSTGWGSLVLRPYQVMCLICYGGRGSSGKMPPEIKKISNCIRRNPDQPFTLACNAGDVYSYQNPGVGDDTPEGRDYNLKRDLDILQKLDLPPGATLPARALLNSFFKMIKTPVGICGYDRVSSRHWRGCSRTRSGSYEQAVIQGLTVLIPPRTACLMETEKRKSVQDMYRKKALAIRPHVIMCAVGHYGKGDAVGNKEHNAMEFIDIIRKKPDIPVQLKRGADWMVCAPCPYRVVDMNACINVNGSGGLNNEWRDLRVLQKIGLQYGAILPARRLMNLILNLIPSTDDICRKHNPTHSAWWDPCSEREEQDYRTGRAMLARELGIRLTH